MGDFDPKEFEPLGIVIRVPKKGRRTGSPAVDLGGDGGRAKRKSLAGGVGYAGAEEGSGGLDRIARIAGKATEVVVKVSSCSRGHRQMREHMNYITRNGKLVGETPHGDIRGRDEVASVAASWWHNRGENAGQRREKTRESFTVTFPIPDGEDRGTILADARRHLENLGENPARKVVQYRNPTQGEMTINISLPLLAEVDGDLTALKKFVRGRFGAGHPCRVKELNPGSKESVNIVLSMPKGEDRDKFLAGARLFVERTFGENHDYVLSEHRDTDHPHVHVAVRSLGNNGQRLQHKKQDLAAWREGLAHQLRAQGLSAEATPRRARGVVEKASSQVIRHLNLRGASWVQRSKIEEAVRSITRAVDSGEKPWEKATQKRQVEIREGWTRLARKLEVEGGEARGIAVAIRSFVAQMGPLETERQRIQKEVGKVIQARTITHPAGPNGQGGMEDHEQDR
ncbi:relaxase/mobilization nuclease domain-containing protein [Xanthomonas campestris]|uniref:relaxase/mobilization nuclease domain-containing protein n=1 Tax=Xanthomonas campestris TaxID=339 RepID=UPI002B22AEA7|nr:relaxase/mobilization nuclease domain-containing protein [Xanthomonas campestris]MEA9776914.1 relaxase/mobilization nuclease domain-containing protein [Xanthomonas campestris pv. raphani]